MDRRHKNKGEQTPKQKRPMDKLSPKDPRKEVGLEKGQIYDNGKKSFFVDKSTGIKIEDVDC